MKKLALLTPFLLLPALFACQVDQVEKVDIAFGTDIGQDAKVEDYSHLKRIDATQLAKLVSDKENFIVIAHSRVEVDCTCWSEWHDNILAPYIKKHRLLVYLIDMDQLQEEKYGLKLNAAYATLGIFKDGVLKYQNGTENQSSTFVTSYTDFADWMNYRIEHPQMYYISLDQLNEKYKSSIPFTIYYSRSSCGDCSYFYANYLKDYLAKNKNLEESFILDCDAEGIRYVRGEDNVLYAPSNKENANIYELEAYEQWSQFKMDYGLAYSEDNVAGWDSGYVPTFFHINPTSKGRKTGDVIDGAMVLYNDSISENRITSTYFTAERLQIEALSYLRECETILESDKILLNKAVGEQGERRASVYRHEETAKFHNPIAKAFLDAFVGNIK